MIDKQIHPHYPSSKEHKVPSGQLTAKGAASISPLASNSAETGRAKNRRVELVEQSSQRHSNIFLIDQAGYFVILAQSV